MKSGIRSAVTQAEIDAYAASKCVPDFMEQEGASERCDSACAKDPINNNAEQPEVTTMEKEFNCAIIFDSNNDPRTVIVLDFDAANGRALVDISDGCCWPDCDQWIPLDILSGKADREALAAFTVLFANHDEEERRERCRQADAFFAELGAQSSGQSGVQPALRLVQGELAD